MPIVDPEIIKSGEKELFASILASFDEFQIEKLFQDTHNLLLKEKMQFKEGKTVVYDSQIAFQLYFSCIAQFSLFLAIFHSPQFVDLGTFLSHLRSRLLRRPRPLRRAPGNRWRRPQKQQGQVLLGQ